MFYQEVPRLSKAQRAKHCILRACNLLKKRAELFIAELFMEIFQNFVRSLLSVELQPVDCKPVTPVKRKFLKISSRATFRNRRMHKREVE